MIDDESALCQAIARVVKERHDVVTQTWARAGLTRIASGQPFDMILCDLMMPELNGKEFFSELGHVAPELQPRVVFLTGGAYTDSMRQFLASQTNPVLEKPLDDDALDAIMRSIVTTRGA